MESPAYKKRIRSLSRFISANNAFFFRKKKEIEMQQYSGDYVLFILAADNSAVK